MDDATLDKILAAVDNARVRWQRGSEAEHQQMGSYYKVSRKALERALHEAMAESPTMAGGLVWRDGFALTNKKCQSPNPIDHPLSFYAQAPVSRMAKGAKVVPVRIIVVYKP